MLDKPVRKIIDPFLNLVATGLIYSKISPTVLTVFGFFIGILACVSVSLGALVAALILLLLNRLLDGLDGVLARRTKVTELGGYLDITLDFLFYSGYVFAFAIYDNANSIYAAFLIFSFLGTGISFLTNALFLEKNPDLNPDQQRKSIFYIGGLAEGTETIIVFVFFTLFPAFFPVVALVFGGICWLTTLTRIIGTATLLKNR